MSAKPPQKPSKPFDLDAFLPYRVSVLASRLSQGLAKVYQDRFGISNPEWRVLAHLSGNAKVSVREIHARVAMDKVKVSRAAARLEACGFVRKATHPTDHRLVELQLSTEGRALFDEIAPLALAYEKQALSGLSPDERRALHTLVEMLLAAPT